jgi:hypothetical protein
MPPCRWEFRQIWSQEAILTAALDGAPVPGLAPEVEREAALHRQVAALWPARRRRRPGGCSIETVCAMLAANRAERRALIARDSVHPQKVFEPGEAMYSFLVLLPLTLITAALGGILIFSPQVRDYVDFIATLDGNADKTRLAIQIAAHIAAYAICCVVVVATTRTISAPVSRDRPDVLCRTQMALEAIFVAVPSLIILALATFVVVRRVEVATGVQMALAGQDLDGPSEILFYVAAGVAVACLLGTVLTGRPQDTRRFGWTLVAIIAGIPIGLWLALLGRVLPTGEVSALLTLAAAAGAVGLAASVAAVVLVKHPMELFQSTLRPFSLTLVDIVAALALACCIALGASLIWSPVDGATFLGLFPVLFLVSAVALVIVAGIFARRSSPVAIVSIAVSVMVVMHGLDFLLPTREFRYRSEVPPALSAKSSLTAREVEAARGTMVLREAFLAWLQARRPAIEAYKKKGKTYPVLVVAAQGGGVYAAYHSALSLARLYDSCPEVVDHMFVLSGVSGGALGSAVFAELVRGVPEASRTKPGEASEGCNPRPGAPRLEEKVKAFFTADFLTPVVDSALLFDIPSLLVPWLRFGMDRAYALEHAFEDAWRRMVKEKLNAPHGKGRTPPYGLEADFYGRWKPGGPVPALFLGTTGVNSGAPVLVSQIKWGQGQSLNVRRVTVAAGREEELEELLRRANAQSERTGSSVIANILDFRPDLQMAMSTAVALSARFPYVTPPANIKRSRKIEQPSGVYDGIDVLELLDGAYFDNSGGSVAIDLLEDLERYLRPQRWDGSEYDGFKEFAADIRFHLVRFTDRPAQRKFTASKDEHFELLTPLVAFNTVRSARGAQLQGVRELKQTRETFFYLSDPWFTPSLSWLLSADTKAGIELRSKGEAKAGDEVCCLMKRPPRDAKPGEPARKRQRRDILLVTSWAEAKKLNALLTQRSASAPQQLPWEVVKFVPDNADAFERVLSLIKDGDDEIDTKVAAKN